VLKIGAGIPLKVKPALHVSSFSFFKWMRPDAELAIDALHNNTCHSTGNHNTLNEHSNDSFSYGLTR